MAKRDKRTRTYVGDVVRQPFAKGSKSEREAVVLSTRYGDFVIRREEGHPFFDSALEDLVGKRIRAYGIRHRHLFIVEKWEELPSRKTDDEDRS